jgi:hypothetical protein
MWSMLQGTSTSLACLMGLPESCGNRRRWVDTSSHQTQDTLALHRQRRFAAVAVQLSTCQLQASPAIR